MTYLIDYDLNSPGKDYTGLIEHLKSTYSWAKICRSSWAVKSNLSAVQIRDDLRRYLDSNDRLFVVEFDDWAAYNLSEQVAQWLKK